MNRHSPTDINTRKHFLTFFDDEYAAVKYEEEWTLPGLADEIRGRSESSKAKLPWLKMARFGDVLSRRNCLRTNANTQAITGVELDYDAGKMTFDAAVEALRSATLRSIVYTSASHTAGVKEKWRVLAPLSCPVDPSQREALAESVNAVIGAVAARESFVISTAFYYGSVNGNEGHRVEVIEGDFIDCRPDLLKVRAAPPPIVRVPLEKEKTAPGVSPGRDVDEIAGLLRASRKISKHGDRQWHNAMLTATASMIGKGWTDAQIFEACAPYCDQGWGDDDIAILVKSGREKWGTPNPGTVVDRMGPIVAAAIEAKGGVGYIPEPAGPSWREKYVNGNPKASLHNARLAIEASQITAREDVFHNRLYLGSMRTDGVLSFVGEVTDARLLGLRFWLSDRYGFDLTEKHVRDAVVEIGRENRFNPVVDMLAEAEAAWDGVKRLDRMAADYLNCEDTLLNSVCVRKVMIAAVRRARQPGCKFDTILVMESPEGWNKSSVWALLAGGGNFSDERIIGHATREVMEQLAGVWIHENADLAGMRKAEVETVKAFASRQVDRARPAYGHFLVEQPRHSIEVGTTNASAYLQSPTGNRRFWPVKVLKSIDLDQVRRDRMLLWGEAAAYESTGESLVLDETLWPDAAEVQESRRVIHPWEDRLAELSPVVGIVNDFGGEWRVTTPVLFRYLGIEEGEQKRHAKDLAEIMRILGWELKQFKMNGQKVRGYVKGGTGTT